MKLPKKFLWLVHSIIIILIIGCNGNYTKPTEVILTSTSTPLVTKTPIPINTLTSLEREDFVRNTLIRETNCKLPCWWDIVPGQTDWNEAEKLLIYLGVRIGSVEGEEIGTILHGTGGFDFAGFSMKNGIGFIERNKIVDRIFIRSDGYNNIKEFQILWANYSPKNILKTYGVPNRVLLNVTDAYALGRGYHLWFFYDNLGIMIRYPGDVFDAPILRVCPVIEGMRSIDLNLQAPNSPLPLDRFDAILEDIRLQTETGKTRGLHTIQEATGMNEKEFYDLFMQDEELICFETPSNIWDVGQ